MSISSDDQYQTLQWLLKYTYVNNMLFVVNNICKQKQSFIIIELCVFLYLLSNIENQNDTRNQNRRL